LKRYKSLGTEIHKLINYIWNKEKLPQEWKESTIVPIYDCSNYRGISLLPTTKKHFIQHSYLKINFIRT